MQLAFLPFSSKLRSSREKKQPKLYYLDFPSMEMVMLFCPLVVNPALCSFIKIYIMEK